MNLLIIFTLAFPLNIVWAQLPNCQRDLAATERRFREIQVEYDSLRAENPVIHAPGAANTRINGLLGESLTRVLSRLDDILSRVPRHEIDALVQRLNEEFPQSTELPFVEPAVRTHTDEFQRLVELINSSRRYGISDPLMTLVGGGTHVSPALTYILYREATEGGGQDPFYIGDATWMELLAENLDVFRASFSAHKNFLTRRADLDDAFQAIINVWNLQDARVKSTYGFLRAVLNRDRPKLTDGWRELVSFDMSSVSDERKLIDGTFFATLLPVGAYGVRLNRHLRRVTQVLTILLETHATADLDRLQATMPELIGRETGRGRGAARKTTAEPNRFSESDPLLRLVVEGLYSISQALNFLLVDEVQGHPDPRSLIRDLLLAQNNKSNSLLVEFTASLRMGLLGPSTFGGIRFSNPLIYDDTGTLRLNPKLTADLRTRLGRRSPHNSELMNYRSHLPCPVASTTACGQSKTGLQVAADLYLKISGQLDY